ncbi:MAG: ABC transporter permease subunit [Anaerolineae bacterium]|nr:ABC transporter permease subunit [Anaerolineae bacterium]
MNRRTRGIVIRQIFLQIFLLLMLVLVMFPVLWIISMAVDPRGISRPTDLNLIPANANLLAFQRLLSEPFSNTFPVYFGQLLMNSLFIALGVSVFTVVLGSSAAYAFSRFRFIGREAGMLTFIVLLLLPSTGIIIPLYLMFNAVVMPSTVAEFFPSIFAGILVGLFVFLLFTLVRRLGKYNPERYINPSPLAVAIGVALFALVAIFATIVVMFARNPLYTTLIADPLKTLNNTLINVQAEVNQRAQSVTQRDTTALRREERAAQAEAVVAAINQLQADVESAANDEAAATRLQQVMTERENLPGALDDYLLTAAQVAYAEYQSGGMPAAIASFAGSIATATDAATSLRQAADSARANVNEAAANLTTAQEALTAAQTDVDQNAQTYYTIRDGVITAMLPYVLIAWVSALVASAAIWLIAKGLSGMIAPKTFIIILLLALVAALIAAFTYSTLQYRLTLVRGNTQTLRTTLLGLALAFSSGGLPFAIWNLKGYFDTIPKELEEAALIDGAGRIETFIRIMVPLALPAFAIVILFSFMSGWTEFILSWIFLTGQTQNYTLAMSLATLTGGANQPPPDMQKFAALSILISLPILVLFFTFQRFIVGGLSLGGVKG